MADFTVNVDCPADLCRVRTGESVRFTNMSSGNVRSLRWDFGDGAVARSAFPSHAWRAPGFYAVTLTASDGDLASELTRTFLVEAAEPAGDCVAGGETRCLLDSRFKVEVKWRDRAGAVAGGRVVPAGTNDSGLFTFFGPENWEVLVKVLDGCRLNGHFWVFAASTTDLGLDITVVDTVTDEARHYRNEAGTPSPAFTDAAAFSESCNPPPRR